MLVLPWVPTGEQPSPWVRAFLEGDFPFPKNGVPCRLGLKLTTNSHIPKRRLISCIFGLNNVIHGLWFHDVCIHHGVEGQTKW